MNTAREIRNIWDEIGRMKTRTAGSASGAVVTFLGLNDTPAAYAGAALRNVRVNAGANALEFTAAGGGDVTGPGASTDNALARFHLATGKIIQNSNAILNDAGLLFLADTANTFMTIGLTINQAGNDNEILALKSSDVAHGCTTWAETDTYGTFQKIHATNGGFDLTGFSLGQIGIRFIGRVGNCNTTRGTTGLGIYHYYGSKITGNTEGNVDAGTNILSVACFTGGALPTVFLVDNTGATWQSSTVWVNENSNAKMTTGITVNQGDADDEIAAFKSSDVTHGCTDYAEADTFGSFKKINAANGGLYQDGFSAGAVGTGSRGFFTTDNTTKSVAGLAAVHAIGYKISGTGIGNATADQNIFAVRTQRGGATETVVIIDEDGDIYYDGALQNYDDFDDALACRDAKQILSGRAKDFLKYNRKSLEEMGIVSAGGFISNKGMTALMLGAISQLHEENNFLKKQIAALAA